LTSSIMHHAVRLPLRLVPEGKVVRVLLGPLRGARWVTGAGTHGCWLGIYERANQKMFAEVLREGDLVVDAGANAGFFSLLAARLIGPEGAVLAFEPSPPNLSKLRRHCALNPGLPINIFEAALVSKDGAGRLSIGGPSECAHLCEVGGIGVELRSLDSVLDDFGWACPPALIKIDVEGAELEVLRGARKTLNSDPRPALVISTHGSTRHEHVVSYLEELGIVPTAHDTSLATGHGRVYCARGSSRV